MRVTVVGAGVVGLTTAVTLEERGHDVRVIAHAQGDATTSAVAGAVWFPYRVGPRAKVTTWAARTRVWLEHLMRDAPDAGVDRLTGYEITDEDGRTRPWWAGVPTMEGDALDLCVEIERVPAPVTGTPAAWRFAAPRAQPALFLPYLTARLRAPVEHAVVTTLSDQPGDVVINCAGLAARELAGDDLLVPLFGQVVIAEPGDVDLATTITDDRDPDAIFYVIPRRTELVLGGCSRPYPLGAIPEIDPEVSARIVGQAHDLGLAIGPVRATRAGLRPYRSEVRLERDPRDERIVHNYGHGGAGYTLARGCAEEVAALLGS
jgi:D-amino-acid oxidase